MIWILCTSGKGLSSIPTRNQLLVKKVWDPSFELKMFSFFRKYDTDLCITAVRAQLLELGRGVLLWRRIPAIQIFCPHLRRCIEVVPERVQPKQSYTMFWKIANAIYKDVSAAWSTNIGITTLYITRYTVYFEMSDPVFKDDLQRIQVSLLSIFKIFNILMCDDANHF